VAGKLDMKKRGARHPFGDSQKNSLIGKKKGKFVALNLFGEREGAPKFFACIEKKKTTHC